MTAPQWLTETEACAYLRVSRWTLQRLRNHHAVGWARVGGRVRYSLDDIDNYLAARTERAAAQPTQTRLPELSILRHRPRK